MDQLRRRLPTYGRKASAGLSRGIFTAACYPPPNKQNAGQAFVWMDRDLDSARGGPLYWKQQPIAQLVVDSIHYGAQHLEYDHAVRDDRESDRIQGYIENHPVKAGLLANAEDYLWSSGGKSRDESRLSRLDSLRHEVK